MRLSRWRSRTLAVAALAALTSSACGGSGGPATGVASSVAGPDITGRGTDDSQQPGTQDPGQTQNTDIAASSATLTAFAGNGIGDRFVDGPALASPMGPGDIVADARGNVFISGYAEIVRVAPDGQLEHLVGNGTPGPATAGPARSSQLGGSAALALDADGNLYAAINDETNDLLVKITPDGVLSVLLHDGDIIIGDYQLTTPNSIAVDNAGNIYMSDNYAYVVKVAPTGGFEVVAGNGQQGSPAPGPATSAPLYAPEGIALDGNGNLYIAVIGWYAVVKITPAGVLSIVAGNGSSGRYGQQVIEGPATGTKIEPPRDVAVDAAGNVYVVGFDQYYPPDYVRDTSPAATEPEREDTGHVLRIDSSDVLSIVAGSGVPGIAADGLAVETSIVPVSICVGLHGELYVLDGRTGVSRLFRIDNSSN